MFHKISETIQYISQENDVIVPCAGIHRKVIATEAHTKVDDSTLNKYMIHSAATSSLYYQLTSQHEAVNIHHTVQELRKKRYFKPKYYIKGMPSQKTTLQC